MSQPNSYRDREYTSYVDSPSRQPNKSAKEVVVGDILDGDVNTVSNPTIANPEATLANTEYSYTFPSDTKRFSIRLRGTARLQVSYSSGQTGVVYRTIFAGETYEESGLEVSSLNIYFQSNKSGEKIEIVSWA